MKAALTIALAAIASAALLVRVPTIAEPLGIDQSLWASAVRGLARGQMLYLDVWEQRPPGIYWLYLAGFEVFGWTPGTVAWLDILASIATTLLVYAIARALSDRLTGCLAAALYASLTVPYWLYRYGGFLERSVCETFIVVAVALGAWCAVKYRDRPSNTLLFAIGLCAGAAVVLKPNAGLYLPALLLWIWFYAPPAGNSGKLRALLVAGFGTAIVPIVAIGWLAARGALGEARIAVVDFNRFYVGQGFSVAAMALAFSKAVWLRMKTDPLWLAGGVASLWAVGRLARSRRLPPLAGLAVLWGAAVALVIFVNGIRLFNSYFIQAFAPLALLAAWFLVDAWRAGGVQRVAAAATAVAMFGFVVKDRYVAKVYDGASTDVRVLRGTLDRTPYLERFGGYGNQRGYSARANDELAAYLREHSEPGERVFVFGINGAGAYFLADRLAAHRFLRVNFFVDTDFPDPRFRLEPVIRDLERVRPRYVVFERNVSRSPMGAAVERLPQHPDVLRLLEMYRYEAQIEDFSVYRLQ